MRFLIDECLSPSLVDVAIQQGLMAGHVAHLGLAGTPDYKLARKALDEDLIFVTQNARDFVKLYARMDVHCGLILLKTQSNDDQQRQMFAATIVHIADEPINSIIEAAIEQDEIVVTSYPFP